MTGDAVIPQEGKIWRNRKMWVAKGPEASWMPLGVSWYVSCELVGGLLAVPEVSWTVTVLDASGEHLGASWAHPGVILKEIDQKWGGP